MATHTWDGIPIAAGHPRGSTIVIRRHTPHGWQYPILHRASRGSHYDGPWAWTPPSGMRQPGEGALHAATRELAEETGLTDLTIHPVDLARGHALWTAVIDDTHHLTLDHEHDRCEWHNAADAAARCTPRVVGEAITTVEATPHIHAAFAAPTGSRSDLSLDGQPGGAAHLHPITERPDFHTAVGHDDAIVIDHRFAPHVHPGVIPRLLWTFLRDVALPPHPRATTVWSAVDLDDANRERELTRAGFTRDGELDLGAGRPQALYGLRLGQWL